MGLSFKSCFSWVLLLPLIYFQGLTEVRAQNCDTTTQYQCGNICCLFEQNCSVSGDGSGVGECNAPMSCVPEDQILCYNKATKNGICCPFTPSGTLIHCDEVSGCWTAAAEGGMPSPGEGSVDAPTQGSPQPPHHMYPKGFFQNTKPKKAKPNVNGICCSWAGCYPCVN